MNVDMRRPILVTGASSGIGHHLVRHLAARGHIVYGTARKEKDLVALGEIANVIPIRLDVRNAEQIRGAVSAVARRGTGLYGLVNNAGVGELGMLSTWAEDELLNIFEVNVFGPFRMTNAFLPFLLESKGRVVNIGSQGGVITDKYYGPYTMTKHALEAYTDTLNYELEPYGVRASIVQPGGIVSNIGANSMPATIARFQRATAVFAEEAAGVLASFESEPTPDDEKEESKTNRKPSSPDIVAAAVYDALFSERPKTRYLVGTRWEGDRVLNALVAQLLEENDSPRHNYSRDELIALLDRHILERSAGKHP
jgi:NAD(P)-dependent dehydrogenase (short-subunit alcohol dehydrogenase family)